MPKRMKQSAPSLKYALLAGAIAIIINTALLQMADLIPLQTAHGGLLKLIDQLFGNSVQATGLPSLWTHWGLPQVGSPGFQLGFHIFVGLLMAIFYAKAVAPTVPGPPWVKGIVYSLLLWLANAFIVLPWIGEGVAGSRHLDLAGMVYFAFAHTVFFLALAVLYHRFTGNAQSRSDFRHTR